MENRKYATKGRYGRYHNQPMDGFLRHTICLDCKDCLEITPPSTKAVNSYFHCAHLEAVKILTTRLQLEAEVEHLAGQDDGGGKALDRINQCLDDMDAFTVENRAAKILNGYGFNMLMQAKNTTHFSKHAYYFGIWSINSSSEFNKLMLVIFMSPTTVAGIVSVFLEEMLKALNSILFLMDFLNGRQPNHIFPEKGLRFLIKGVLELAKEPSRLCVDEICCCLDSLFSGMVLSLGFWSNLEEKKMDCAMGEGDQTMSKHRSRRDIQDVLKKRVQRLRRVSDGAFGGVEDEEVVVGEGVVVNSSSLEMLTNSCLGGIMVNLIFLEGFEEEAFVEFMVDFG
ncbi:hypothetical protein Tco_1392915 [Tanacetum coccineum]